MDTAAKLLRMQGSLAKLELITGPLSTDLRESKGRTENLLAALEPMSRMRNLCVMFAHSCPHMDRLRLPDLSGLTALQDLAWNVNALPPPGLEALAPSLMHLLVGAFTVERWPQVLAQLTGLRSLWLTAAGDYRMRPQDLGFLTALRGSLESLVLFGTAVWPAGLPKALVACTRLTVLQVAGSPYNMGDAFAAAAAPPRLLPTRGVSAGQHMAGLELLTGLRELSLTWTMLRTLPPQLTALTALTNLTLYGEGDLLISTAGELWGLLERLPALQRLGMNRASVATVPLAERASLVAAFPRVRLCGLVPGDSLDSDGEW